MVPNGWEHVRLNGLCLAVTSGSRDWAKYYSDQGSKFIRMTNLQRENIYLNLSDLKYVDVQSNSSDGKRTSLKAGDILMSITAELGKIGWVHDGLGEAFINQHTALIRLDDKKSNSKYIAYLLSSKDMNHRINRLNDSGAKAGLNLPTIRSIPLNVPPLPEQHKIANILETWDKAISTTECLIDNSKRQKKSLMQQLLTGKKRLLDDSGKPFEGEWEEKDLNDVFCFTRGSVQKTSKNGRNQLVVMGSISESGLLLTKNQTDAEKNLLEDGDLVMPERDIGKGRIIGRTAMINETNKFVLGPNVLRLQVKHSSKMHSKFWNYLFNSQIFRKKFKRIVSGTGQLMTTSKDIKRLSCSVPGCFEEQQKIAAVLINADKEIALFDQQLTDLKHEKKALMQQLLTGKHRVKIDEAEVA